MTTAITEEALSRTRGALVLVQVVSGATSAVGRRASTACIARSIAGHASQWGR